MHHGKRIMDLIFHYKANLDYSALWKEGIGSNVGLLWNRVHCRMWVWNQMSHYQAIRDYSASKKECIGSDVPYLSYFGLQCIVERGCGIKCPIIKPFWTTVHYAKRAWDQKSNYQAISDYSALCEESMGSKVQSSGNFRLQCIVQREYGIKSPMIRLFQTSVHCEKRGFVPP